MAQARHLATFITSGSTSSQGSILTNTHCGGCVVHASIRPTVIGGQARHIPFSTSGSTASQRSIAYRPTVIVVAL